MHRVNLEAPQEGWGLQAGSRVGPPSTRLQFEQLTGDNYRQYTDT